MDEFLSGLANYTEKENHYHSIDAYPGTEFEQTENILKLFYPLIQFRFVGGCVQYILNNKNTDIGIYGFRYYLNYIILPTIEKYRNSLPKLSDMENDFNAVKGYKKEDYNKAFIDVYFPGVDYEEDYQAYTQLLNQIPKPISGITEFQKRVNLPRVISYSGDYPERDYPEIDNRIDYLRYKVNNHKNNLASIKKVIELLIRFDKNFDESLNKINTYLAVLEEKRPERFW